MSINATENERARAQQFFHGVFGEGSGVGIPMVSFRYAEACLVGVVGDGDEG
jgi:hypothetical protein